MGESSKTGAAPAVGATAPPPAGARPDAEPSSKLDRFLSFSRNLRIQKRKVMPTPEPMREDLGEGPTVVFIGGNAIALMVIQNVHYTPGPRLRLPIGMWPPEQTQPVETNQLIDECHKNKLSCKLDRIHDVMRAADGAHEMIEQMTTWVEKENLFGNLARCRNKVKLWVVNFSYDNAKWSEGSIVAEVLTAASIGSMRTFLIRILDSAPDVQVLVTATLHRKHIYRPRSESFGLRHSHPNAPYVNSVDQWPVDRANRQLEGLVNDLAKTYSYVGISPAKRSICCSRDERSDIKPSATESKPEPDLPREIPRIAFLPMPDWPGGSKLCFHTEITLLHGGYMTWMRALYPKVVAMLSQTDEIRRSLLSETSKSPSTSVSEASKTNRFRRWTSGTGRKSGNSSKAKGKERETPAVTKKDAGSGGPSSQGNESLISDDGKPEGGPGTKAQGKQKDTSEVTKQDAGPGGPSNQGNESLAPDDGKPEGGPSTKAQGKQKDTSEVTKQDAGPGGPGSQGKPEPASSTPAPSTGRGPVVMRTRQWLVPDLYQGPTTGVVPTEVHIASFPSPTDTSPPLVTKESRALHTAMRESDAAGIEPAAP